MTEETKQKIAESKRANAVSKTDFDTLKSNVDNLKDNIATLLELMQKPKEEVAKIAVENKKIDEASPDAQDVNPRYDAAARQILGDRVERTYVKYPKGGGTLFTIVIKKDYSNAGQAYLGLTKEDHRTVNIEREEYRGEDGVIAWSKLVLQNLKRSDINR